MTVSRRIIKRMATVKETTAREMIPEKALIMSGFGINSEMETQEVLARAGMASDIVHINDLIAGLIGFQTTGCWSSPVVSRTAMTPVPAMPMQTGYATISGKILGNFSMATTSCLGSATASRYWQTSGWSRHSISSITAISP